MATGKRKNNTIDFETRFIKFQALCRRVIDEYGKGNREYVIGEIKIMLDFLKRDPALHEFLIVFSEQHAFYSEHLRWIKPLKTEVYDMWIIQIKDFCIMVERPFDNEFLPALKAFRGDLPSPDKIDRITEETKGAIYRIHFSGIKKTFDLLPTVLPGCFAKGKVTGQWKAFKNAIDGGKLNPLEKFRLNEAFQKLFDDDEYDFFADDGLFKFPVIVPISRKAQTLDKQLRAWQPRQRKTSMGEQEEEME